MTIERSLRMIAGGLVAASVLLGMYVNPLFLWFTLFVGLITQGKARFPCANLGFFPFPAAWDKLIPEAFFFRNIYEPDVRRFLEGRRR